jgi:hypothetical protein
VNVNIIVKYIIIPAQISCPFNNPYAVENGFYCCNSIKRLNNIGINPKCNDGSLQVADPKECCSSALIQCTNNYTGCYTNNNRRFNGKFFPSAVLFHLPFHI